MLGLAWRKKQYGTIKPCWQPLTHGQGQTNGKYSWCTATSLQQQRETERERWTDRQTDRDREREREREKERERERETDRQTDRLTDAETVRRRDSQTKKLIINISSDELKSLLAFPYLLFCSFHFT